MKNRWCDGCVPASCVWCDGGVVLWLCVVVSGVCGVGCGVGGVGVSGVEGVGGGRVVA
jgi:hypothetical protein